MYDCLPKKKCIVKLSIRLLQFFILVIQPLHGLCVVATMPSDFVNKVWVLQLSHIHHPYILLSCKQFIWTFLFGIKYVGWTSLLFARNGLWNATSSKSEMIMKKKRTFFGLAMWVYKCNEWWEKKWIVCVCEWANISC